MRRAVERRKCGPALGNAVPWTAGRATAYHRSRRDGEWGEPPMTNIDETAPPPPADGWRVRHDTESFGPYSEAQMRAFVIEGRIAAQTPVRYGDESDWQSAARHPVFGPIFATVASAGPPRPEQTREEAPDLSGAPGGASAEAVGPAGVPTGIAAPGGELPSGETTTMAHIVYALYVASFFTGGLAGIVGVIIAHVKRNDVRGTWLETHYRWQIRTFWISLGAAIICVLLYGIFMIGVFFPPILYILVAIWYIWRIVKGWTRLGSNRPLEDPTAWA